MRYFNRVCQIDISPNIRVTNLRVAFEVFKSIESDRNSCRVDIYNLSETTRNNIPNDANSLVRISAGYSENAGLLHIGQGNISNVIQTFKSPEIITTIYSKDGFKQTKNNVVSLSFSEKTPLKNIIDKLAANLSLPISYANYDNTVLQGGYSYMGGVQGALDELATQFDFNWSIQDGELVIIKKNSSTKKQVVFLSATTGLIENPEKIIKTKSIEDVQRDEYKIVALMQPQLQAGDLVDIKSKIINGLFTIFELQHKGDTFGNDWYTLMTVYKSL